MKTRIDKGLVNYHGKAGSTIYGWGLGFKYLRVMRGIRIIIYLHSGSCWYLDTGIN